MVICTVYVFLQDVKRFEFPKALYKLPIIIIITIKCHARTSAICTNMYFLIRIFIISIDKWGLFPEGKLDTQSGLQCPVTNFLTVPEHW